MKQIINWNEYNSDGTTTEDNKDKLTEHLRNQLIKSWAKSYYKDYYDKHKNNESKIEVSLIDLIESDTNETNKMLIAPCDEYKTTITITPYEPYGSSDIDISINIKTK